MMQMEFKYLLFLLLSISSGPNKKDYLISSAKYSFHQLKQIAHLSGTEIGFSLTQQGSCFNINQD